MKVPTLTSARTNPASTAAGYVRGSASTAGAQAVSRGLNNLGDAYTKLEATFKQRDEQTNRFNSLKGLSEMQTQAAEQLTELKRNYDPSGKGFVDAANKVFTGLEEQYISNVPPDLSEEFKYRSQTIRQSVLGDALSFQYQSGDAWFKQGVSDELDKARVILDQTPEALEAQQSHIVEIINATDLPEAEKLDLARQAAISLAAVTYKAEIRRDPSLAVSVGVGDMGDGDTAAAAILRKEEGFRETPYWDVNAWRIGYGSDTITRADGTSVPVTQGMRITREDAERDLQYRLTQREGKVAREQLGETWNQLTPNVQGALASVAYNYGSLPDTVVTAAKSGDTETLAKAVAGLSSNPDRRKNEAAIIRGEKGLDTDPRFAMIPYEDRVALREDGDREAKALAVQQAAAAKAQREAAQNDLYLGLLDGNKGKMDIDNARATGILDDYDSVNKALGIIKTRDEEINLAQAGYEKIASGSAWDPTSADDKKMLNAVVKQGNGLARLNSGDQDYITQEIVPLANQIGDIPTDVAGTLMGMVRGGDNQRMLYAIDSLAQLRDANPTAFNQRVSEDVARQVDLWDARKDITPQDELVSMLRGGTTQSERQMREVLRSEAKDLLGRSEGGISKLRTKADEVIESFGGYTWSPETAPLARQAFDKEFQTLFVDEFSKTGSEEVATENAKKALERSWGVTQVGSSKTLMKYPPEKVGYRAINGSYDWINEAARKDLSLGATENFDLFSDDQTLQEFQRFQRDPAAAPPSYRAFIKDENGVYRERTDENGLPLRMNFQPDPVVLEKEARTYDLREERFQLEETIANYSRMQVLASEGGMEIPAEDVEAYNAAEARLAEILAEEETLVEPDPMGEQIRQNMTSGGLF